MYAEKISQKLSSAASIYAHITLTSPLVSLTGKEFQI